MAEGGNASPPGSRTGRNREPARRLRARSGSGIEPVARSFGITPETTAGRVNAEAHAPGIVQSVRAPYANCLAGVYIEHEPTSRLVVRLTGYDAVQPQVYQFGADRLKVSFELGAPQTLAELQRSFNSRFPALVKAVPDFVSGYVDERTGEIVVEVVGNRKASQFADLRKSVSDYFGAPVRIATLDSPVANQAVEGGGHLQFTNPFSLTQNCTGAFTVYQSLSSRYGTLTAGHCNSSSGPYSYVSPLGTPSHTINKVALLDTADTDIGWAYISTSSSDATSRFYDGANYVTRVGTVTKAATNVGDYLCHYGMGSTGKNCGLVVTTSYNPGSICVGGASACNAVFVRVDITGNNKCLAADSGGSWFDVAKAAGIHKAGSNSGTDSVCVYTTIDDISGMGVSLL